MTVEEQLAFFEKLEEDPKHVFIFEHYSIR